MSEFLHVQLDISETTIGLDIYQFQFLLISQIKVTEKNRLIFPSISICVSSILFQDQTLPFLQY